MSINHRTLEDDMLAIEKYIEYNVGRCVKIFISVTEIYDTMFNFSPRKSLKCMIYISAVGSL